MVIGNDFGAPDASRRFPVHDGGAPAPAQSVQMSKEPAAMMVYLPPQGIHGLTMNGGGIAGMPLGTMPLGTMPGAFGYPPQQPL